MSDFHFLRPMWLLALLPCVLLFAVLWYHRTQSSSWHAVIDRHLLTHLWLEAPGRQSRVPLIMLGMGWLLVILVLAGPVWERLPEPVWRTVASRIIVLDLSASMAATDLAPSRLHRARYKIQDILDKTQEGRIGLVVFAGEAHIVTPLTEDAATLTNLLGALNPDIIPEAGNFAAPALRMAGSLLQQAGLHYGDVLLLSDGLDDISASLAAARDLKAYGYRLSVLAIAEPNTDIEMLNALARAGGGAFSLLTTSDHDIDQVLLELEQVSSMQTRLDSSVERWADYGVWLLPVILILAAAGFRRGWLSGLLLVMFLPPPAQALEWRDLWLRADQQAADALAQGRPDDAARLFIDPAWRGMALYQAGNYAAAAEAFAAANGIEADYNRANALAKAGQLDQAAQVYRQVLQRKPEHADAQANLALIEALLQQQERQQEAQNDDGPQQSSADNEDESQAGNENTVQENRQENDTQINSSPERQQQQASRDNDNHSQANLPDTEVSEEVRQAIQERPDTMDAARQDVEQQTASTEYQENTDSKGQWEGGMNPSWPVGNPYDEAELALDQWLRQIPEDPSGLLRRKFMLEHLRRHQEKR